MVTVVGLGFVGLTTALGFAEYGHKVYGIEVDAARLAKIQSGRLPFLEPGLDEACITAWAPPTVRMGRRI